MDLKPLLDAIDTLGTLGLAIFALYAFFSRKVVSISEVAELIARHKSEIDEQDEEHARQLAYVDARRAEEREGRIAAEKRVSAFATSFNEVLAVMRGIKEEVIRGGRGE